MNPNPPASPTASIPAGAFHRRPLPDGLVDFSSPEGRALLREAMGAGDAEAFFPLVAQLHTQAEPAWCGLGTLVTVLNALDLDPGRPWKGPWRWFGEELLDCCKSLELATAEGLTLIEVACLARCNGALAEPVHAAAGGDDAFRAALVESVRAPGGPFVVAGYDRAAMNQTGAGHYSPLAAWHAERDLVLILDVARFKYPPHWAPVSQLWRAMSVVDPATGLPRGWIRLSRTQDVAVTPDEAGALSERLAALGGVRVPSCPGRG